MNVQVSFETHLRILLNEEFPQPRIENCVRGWKEYFQKMHITEPLEQDNEYYGIIKARVKSGQISLAPPL